MARRNNKAFTKRLIFGVVGLIAGILASALLPAKFNPAVIISGLLNKEEQQ